MTPVRLAGSVASVVAGLWTVLLSQMGLVSKIGSAHVVSSHLSDGLLTIGVFLVLVSIISLIGPRLLFVLAAILCVTILSIVYIFWARISPDYRVVASALVALALILDAVGSASAKELSEKDSPLNLPVFG